MNNTTASNLVDKILAYEDGELNVVEIIDLFQYLVTSDTILGLQGSYQRQAHALIQAGLIVRS